MSEKKMTLSAQLKKYARNKKISRFLLNPRWDDESGKLYDPEIILEDGVRIRFMPVPGTDEWGVEPIVVSWSLKKGGK